MAGLLVIVNALCYFLPVISFPISQQAQIVLNERSRSAETVHSALKAAAIIPDVLDDFTPSISLSLTFSSSHTAVSLGNTIPVSDTSSAPAFQLIPFHNQPSLSPTRTFSSNVTYTLALSDPDATSRANPTKSQMCHWIVTGIKLGGVNETEGLHRAEDSTYGLDMPGSFTGPGRSMVELVNYMQPAPPKKTGKHRYVFVLLAPEDGKDGGGKELKRPKEREHFGYGKKRKGVMEWAKENNLVPVGADFFYAEHK